MDGSLLLLIASAKSLSVSAEFVSFSEDESLSGAHMRYDPLKHHRRSTRLSGWDYTHPGWYYVTIVVKDREQHFGHVVHDSVEHSPLGFIADAYWREIPQHHVGTELDEHIVMPNHVDGIVIINEKQNTDVNGGDVNGGDVDSGGGQPVGTLKVGMCPVGSSPGRGDSMITSSAMRKNCLASEDTFGIMPSIGRLTKKT